MKTPQIPTMPVPSQPPAGSPSPEPAAGGISSGGEDGSVAFEYALVVAAIGLPLVTVVFFLLQIVSDMYRAQMLILNVPFP